MNSQRTIGLVIVFLGLVGLATVVGGFVLAYQGEPIPGELIAIGSGAIGGLAGILAKTGTEPMQVIQAEPVELANPQAADRAPAPDLAPLRAQLVHAAEGILAAAQAMGDEEPLEAVLADDAGGQ